MNYHDRANAPTEALIQREHHRIATLGRNQIIRDHYKTQFLNGERITRLLPRKKRPRQFNRMISAAMNSYWKIFGLADRILAIRKEISK